MRKLCVLGWRPHGRTPLYFRGDDRWEIFLPYISEERLSQGRTKGWVEDIANARVFEVPILLDERSFAKGFIKDRFSVYPYEQEVLATQIFRPIRRPRPWKPPDTPR